MKWQTGNYTRRFAIFFEDRRTPIEVRFAFEKRLTILLVLEQLQEESLKESLTYAADYASSYEGLHGRIELSFLALGTYRFCFDAARARDQKGFLPPLPGSKFAEVGVLDEPKFHEDVERLFSIWVDGLAVVDAVEPMTPEARKIFLRQSRNAVEDDTRLRELQRDHTGVAAAQQAVLDDLKAGKYFVSASHEGVVRVQMEGSQLVRTEDGEAPSVERYATREEILRYLRNRFDWEACRDTIPHRPPELEIWKFIRSQLE